MAKKHYAVHTGRISGIYSSWAECEAQVKGFGGAKYKAFPSLEEAQAFISGDGTLKAKEDRLNEASKQADIQLTSKGLVDKKGQKALENTCDVVAYIDGSFDASTKTVGYGGIIFFEGKEVSFSLGTKDESYAAVWNVAGELLGAMHVIAFAKEHQATSCALFYDYQGIEMWATGKWKANNPITQHYANFMKATAKELHIEFHKVAAHKGDKYNEMVDALAKEGLKKG